MDKPWYKSVTILSAIGLAVMQTLEQTGTLPTGTQSGVVAVVNALAQLGVLFGLRRAVG